MEFLLNKITCKNKLILSKSDLVDYLFKHQPEILITMGAGDIDRLVDKIGMSIWNKNKEVTIEDIRFINISDFTSNWKDIGCALSNENITIAYHNSFKELTSDFNKDMYMLKLEDLDTIDEDYLVYVDYNKLGHINYHSDPEKFINAVREQNKEMFDMIIYPEEFDTNEYNDLAENSWMSVSVSPFSTFAVTCEELTSLTVKVAPSGTL